MVRTHALRPTRSYATTEARTKLPELVNEMVAVVEPGASLLSHAVEVGPRNRGGVVILPTIDLDAAIDRETAMRTELDALEDELENIAVGLMLADRLEQSTGATVSVDDFVRELGHEDLLEG